MTTLRAETYELAQEPRKPERARCPHCGGNIAIRRVSGQRILEYHHDDAIGYTRWCDGSDMDIDKDAPTCRPADRTIVTENVDFAHQL